MRLHPWARERYELTITTVPAIAPGAWEASFDKGTTWHAAEVIESRSTWLVRGPDYDPSSGDVTSSILLPKGVASPWLRGVDNPEVVVRSAPTIFVTF